MFELLQVFTVVLVAIAMALSLAHALELPGKLRLRKEEYLAVQPIYYPGFTVGGGIGEAGGLLATLLLVLLTPFGTPAFWLTLGSFIALAATHLLYWVLTHPVNNFWLEDFELKGFGARFFGVDPLRRAKRDDRCATTDWIALRDRWEHSHVARAAFAMLGLILLVSAVAL